MLLLFSLSSARRWNCINAITRSTDQLGKEEMSRASYENNVTVNLPFLSVSSSSFSFLTVESASITYESARRQTGLSFYIRGPGIFPGYFHSKMEEK